MHTLAPPWVLAARASGRLDPWPLLEAVGGPQALAQADSSTLMKAGLSLDLAARLGDTLPLGCEVPFLLAGQEGYPQALNQLPYAPPVLFHRGDPAVLQQPAVAIVGSRSCTPAGRRAAAELAQAACLAGFAVVSGLAVGIDTAAHQAAARAGTTIAVLGQGLEAPVSTGTRRFRESLVRTGGAVVSEFLPTDPAQPFTFLQRNRIIAGLAVATVVVEAGHRSGALSTARHALAAGREVLAVPGPYWQPSSAGCLDLIEQGATVVRGPATLLKLLGSAELALGGARADRLPEGARGLVDLLQRGGTLEQLSRRAGLDLVRTLALLAELEASGLVRRAPGQRYELI